MGKTYKDRRKSDDNDYDIAEKKRKNKKFRKSRDKKNKQLKELVI